MFFLPQPVAQPIHAKPLTLTLHKQLDKCAKDNKCHYIVSNCSLLVAKGIFEKVFVSSFMVGQHMMTLMGRLVVGVQSFMRRIFPLFYFS